MGFLRQAECHPEFTSQASGDEFAPLRLRAEVQEHQDVGEVPYHAVFVLQVVCEADAAAVDGVRGHVEAHGAHVQVHVRVGFAAELGGEGEPVEAVVVGQTPGLGEEGFPFVPWEALVVPVCAGVFAAVVEEAVVVVLVLEGEDRGLDEGVEGADVVDKVWGEVEIHFGGHAEYWS